jgi:ABC-2 type transport system ATP-binding protein
MIGGERLSMVSLRELEVQRGALHIGPVSLELHPGSCAAFIGPNGSGKSSILLSVLGLIRVERGEVHINGSPVTRTRPPLGVGVVLAWPGFYPWVSGAENLALAAEGDRAALDRISTLLDEVGLGAAGRKRVSDYSTGMVRRLEVARALLFEPTVLLLDEPTNGLDSESRGWLVGRLRERLSCGNSVLLATHDPELVAALGARKFSLPAGTITDSGAPG